jgi:hypothetical protein
MKDPLTDADLRERLQELGRREGAKAPRLESVLRGRRPAPDARPGGLRIGEWRQPAVALAGLLLVAVVAWWRPMGPVGGGPPVPRVESSGSDPVEEWALPTDGLLTEGREGTAPEVERLSREIEGLLQP